MAETLATLTLRAQQESDQVNSGFLSASEWTTNINKSLTEIYGLTATVYGADYYYQTPNTGYLFTTDGVSEYFNLPADFFKLLGIDVLYGAANQWVGLKPFAFADRTKFSAINSPIPAAGQQLRVFYIPRVTPLVAAGDAIPDALSMNGWDEYIVVDAAMKALAKEESDVSVMGGRKQALIERINAEAENRDAGMTANIVDTRSRGSPAMQYRLAGNQIHLIGWRITGWPGPDWDMARDDNGWWG